MGGDGSNFPRFLIEMLKSIFSPHGDLYIFFAAVLTVGVMLRIFAVRSEITEEIGIMPDNPDWAETDRRRLNRWYTMFLTLISIFPLLGMFGTVAALLNLDFSDPAGSIDSVKTDFFKALTSTAWGIVFSVVFKLINSWFFYDVEDIYDEIDEIVRKNRRGGDDDGGDKAGGRNEGRKRNAPRLVKKPVRKSPKSAEDDLYGGGE